MEGDEGVNQAQGDVRDPTGMFWRNIKSQSDSSDSGGRRSDSSQELCRISIKCSVPEPSSSQDENTKTKSESVSPPIITEDLAINVSRHSDEESGKSGDEHSQKSLDVLLDTSANKPLSPTSSVTSQRKLEWDSLADVGYGNESDRKNSASSLSTLERLALHQQYSNNDTKESLGPPTAQSTPFDDAENKSKVRKGVGKKTKFYKRDVDFVEVNVPQGSSNASQAINVNLTKHISFSVEKDGGVTVENVKRDVNISPEKVSVETEVTPQIRFDKEIQTTLTKSQEKKCDNDTPKMNQTNQKIPILISLNTLRNRNRRKKIRIARRKIKNRKREVVKRATPPVQERSGEQLSAAESFEYMPGHIYNQNHLKSNQSKSGTTVGNKSSLESSGALTTDSSKGSKHSFTKDLEKSIDLLKVALRDRYDDNILKKKLVKEVVQQLLKTKYKDDDSTDFLSGLSLSSKKNGLRENNSTSTSDGNSISIRPKKSILRMDKFNASAIASTSQSAPNLPTASNSDKPVRTNLVKHLTSSNTDTEMSSREKVCDNSLTKATSQELYQKYLAALKREEAYKKHLKDKEIFLKQKLTNSDSAFKVPERKDLNVNKRLKDLMKDLTRNNYDDGSGDASKLEGGSDNGDFERYVALKNQRSHSVFTLSSGNSDCPNKKQLKKKLQNDIRDACKPGPSYYCSCSHQAPNIKIGVTDSSVQVNIKDQLEAKEVENKKHNRQCSNETPQNTARIVSDNVTGDIKYVCLCTGKAMKSQEVQDNFLIYKCSRLTNRGVQEGDSLSRGAKVCGQSVYDTSNDKSQSTSSCKSCKTQKVSETDSIDNIPLKRSSKSSQTNLLIKMICGQTSEKSSSSDKREPKNCTKNPCTESKNDKQLIQEATRCIQTEISINPKISDPSLTDINIMNDCDCVKIISEQYKEVKNTASRSDVRDWQSDAEAGTSCGTGRNHATSEDSIEELLEDVKDMPFIESDDNNKFQVPSENGMRDVTENFTIPIQGTNMKLMVSIGSNERKQLPDEKIVQGSCKGVATEKLDCIEESTSLLEECSKGVQYHNEMDVPLTDRCCTLYGQDSNSNKISTTDNKPPKLKSCLVNTCFSQGEPKYNTYPKNVQLHENKPFMRSNTDTGVLGCTLIQTKPPNKKDMTTQQDFAFGDSCLNAKPDQGIHDDILFKKPKVSQSNCCGALTNIVDTIPIGVQTDFPKGEPNEYLSDDKNKNKEGDNKIEPKPPCDCGQRIKKPEIITETKIPKCCTIQQSCSETATESLESNKSKSTTNTDEDCRKSCKSNKSDQNTSKDPILTMIKDITRRYSKDDFEKNKRKKCFREIVTVLNYLLDTDDSTDRDAKPTTSAESNSDTINPKNVSECCQTEIPVDKAVQSSKKKTCGSTNSSELPTSTDIPGTSSDSATCKVLSKIKKECEKYHQKRCKSHTGGKKCEVSSTTSVSCEQCRRVHHCSCRYHKCKHHRSKSNAEKAQKKSLAYNLIIQTSESMISEETCENKCRPLKNIIVKVPSKKKVDKVPFKEVESKIEKRMYCSPRYDKTQRSRSLPNDCDISSTDECLKRAQTCTVRDYLECNRPDFVDKCSQRQNNLKVISETRANERAAHRELLSMHVDKQLPLSSLNVQDIRHLAREFGIDAARRNRAPKFISEREMKKHSEKIYKSLPEVVRKKEEIKKDNIKKTNLLMANIFKKNLQKKTLSGAVNLSNYSTVIKI